MTVPRFHAVTVFDVAQTEGEPLPDIRPEELKDTVNDYETFLKEVEKYNSFEGYCELKKVRDLIESQQGKLLYKPKKQIGKLELKK